MDGLLKLATAEAKGEVASPRALGSLQQRQQQVAISESVLRILQPAGAMDSGLLGSVLDSVHSKVTAEFNKQSMVCLSLCYRVMLVTRLPKESHHNQRQRSRWYKLGCGVVKWSLGAGCCGGCHRDSHRSRRLVWREQATSCTRVEFCPWCDAENVRINLFVLIR